VLLPEGLQAKEIALYLERRLKWAGAKRPFFPGDVADELGRYAQGNPRRVNRLASICLAAGRRKSGPEAGGPRMLVRRRQRGAIPTTAAGGSMIISLGINSWANVAFFLTSSERSSAT